MTVLFPVRAAGAVCVMLVLAACATEPPQQAAPPLDEDTVRPAVVVPVDPEEDAGAVPTPRPAPSQTGEASWYGDAFAGRPTASGEIFDPSTLTAAHPTLPFGSQVRVTRVDTGDSVVVRINDRGPYTGGRIIDVSRAAAEVLDMIQAGVAEVRVQVLSQP